MHLPVRFTPELSGLRHLILGVLKPRVVLGQKERLYGRACLPFKRYHAVFPLLGGFVRLVYRCKETSVQAYHVPAGSRLGDVVLFCIHSQPARRVGQVLLVPGLTADIKLGPLLSFLTELRTSVSARSCTRYLLAGPHPIVLWRRPSIPSTWFRISCLG